MVGADTMSYVQLLFSAWAALTGGWWLTCAHTQRGYGIHRHEGQASAEPSGLAQAVRGLAHQAQVVADGSTQLQGNAPRAAVGVRTCSATKKASFCSLSASKVSPSTGLKGFQVRSAAPKGVTRKAATRAILCSAGQQQGTHTRSQQCRHTAFARYCRHHVCRCLQAPRNQ